MMISVALIEDDDAIAEELVGHLKRYAEESKGAVTVNTVRFSDAISFIENYKPRYDLVLMDIMLPEMDGLTASRKLREFDPNVLLIFVTNMSQFAVKGYEVSAFDFIVKPVRYGDLSLKLDRVVERLSVAAEKKVRIYSQGAEHMMPISDIKYVEVTGHKLLWHTAHGDFAMCGNLGKLENELPKSVFVRINSCYIINMKYVTLVKAQTVTVGGEELQISQSRKKKFLGAMAEYIGDGGGVLTNVRTQRVFLVQSVVYRRAHYCRNADSSAPAKAKQVCAQGGGKRYRVYRIFVGDTRCEPLRALYVVYISGDFCVQRRRDQVLF